MKKPFSRLLLALIASIFINALVQVAGLDELLLLPVSLMSMSIFPDYGQSMGSGLIIMFSPLLAYAMAFWTVGTMCSMLMELFEVHPNSQQQSNTDSQSNLRS